MDGCDAFGQTKSRWLSEDISEYDQGLRELYETLSKASLLSRDCDVPMIRFLIDMALLETEEHAAGVNEDREQQQSE